MAKAATKVPAKSPARPETSLSRPAFMNEHGADGTENLGMDDLETPRLKLIQALSPELEEYNDLKAGDFLHTATGDIFHEPFRAVPVYIDRQYILWRPREEGGGILARAVDGVHWSPADTEFEVKLDKKDGGTKVKWKTAKTVARSGLAEWGTMNPADSNSPPAATLMYNYVLAFPDRPDLIPAAMTFQRSAVKVGRKLNSNVKVHRAPLYGLVYEFSSRTDRNPVGQEFKNIGFRSDGFLTDEKLFNQYQELHESFKQAGLTVKDLESLQAEEGDDGDDDEGDGKAPRY